MYKRQAVERYTQSTNRRVSFEYLLIKDVNDSEEDLQALLDFCDRLLCHVNLLPVNTVEGSPLQAASPATAKHWVETLTHHGVETSFRKSRGADIDGACGQLKNKLAQGTFR